MTYNLFQFQILQCILLTDLFTAILSRLRACLCTDWLSYLCFSCYIKTHVSKMQKKKSRIRASKSYRQDMRPFSGSCSSLNQFCSVGMSDVLLLGKNESTGASRLSKPSTQSRILFWCKLLRVWFPFVIDVLALDSERLYALSCSRFF